MHSEKAELPARWLVLSGVWFLYFSFGLVMSSMAPLVNVIIADLDITRREMGTVLGAWQFVYLFSVIPMGLLLARVGDLYALVAAALLMAISATLRYLAPDVTLLWFAVALFGIGGPLISIGAPKVIAQWFGSNERGVAMGIYMTGPMLGGICALMLSNSVLMPLFDHQWRQIFLLYAAVSAFAALCWWWVYRRHAAALPDGGKTRRHTGDFAAYRYLLKNQLVLTILLMSIGIFTFSHGLGSWLPAILASKGMTPVQAGYWASIPAAVSVIASLTIPRLARGGRHYLILSCMCLAATIAVLAMLSVQGWWLLLIALIAQGMASGSMMTMAMLVMMESDSVGPEYIGAASGLFFTVAQIGGVSGPVGIGALAHHYGHFDASLTGLAVVCLLLLLVSLTIKRLDKPTQMMAESES